MKPSPDQPSSLNSIQMGIGTWAWGDRLYWGYGRDYADTDLEAAFDTAVLAGIRFFDTAEIYGQGKSEQLVGRFASHHPEQLLIGTKFMPFPWRLSGGRLINALKHSLQRLGMERIFLYQIHFPLPPVTIETWMEAMARTVQDGLVSVVGVSNFNRTQVNRAFGTLTQQGVTLASNQVEYSLLDRRIEKNGLLADCKALNIAVIAYSPLAQGLLTGKYAPDQPPGGMRMRQVNRKYLAEIQPLIQLLRKIGTNHDGKTPAQVSLNWLIQKGAIPIPGVKNVRQVEQNLGALGWNLTETEIAQLDELSDKINSHPH